MENARLEHKLIVPAHLVPLNALQNFTVSLKNDEGEMVDYAYYYIDYAQNLYYFDRGDLGQIYKTFPYLTIEDRRSAPLMNSSNIVTNKGLGLTFTGKLRENQQPVADALINGLGYGQLKAHPRFGKTVVMVNVVCRLGLKTLMLSHQIDLAKQAYDKFLQYTNVAELEAVAGRKIVGIVDKWEDMLKFDVCIMPYQKFVSGKDKEVWLDKLRNQFGLIFIDECFEYSTKVTLANGSQENIGKLVSRLLNGDNIHVMSYNDETKIWEPKRVSGYSKKRATNEWVRVGLGGSSGVLCSPNHGWYLEGYKKTRADELKIGDRVMVLPNNDGRISYPRALGEWQKQLIYGGVLGDFHLQSTKNRARVKVVQGKKQEEYYKYKEKILGDYLRADTKEYLQGYSKVGTCSNNSLSSVEILDIQNVWEQQPEMFIKLMDDRAWAFLFMDNGSYSNSSARLHINRLDEKDASIVVKVLNERFNINTVLKDYKGCTITFSVADYDIFCERVGKYFHPSMKYKLRKDFIFEEGYDDSQNHSLETVTSLSKKPIKDKSPMMYNIQVDDNHNYLVGSAKFLVSNCHKVKADTYAHTVSSFNSKFRYGVSGTTELKNNMHLLGLHVLGPVVVEGHGDQLPFSVTTYNTGVAVAIRPGKMFFTMALSYLAGHDGRNQFMLSVIKPWLEAGHTIIATSERTGHCDWFADQIKKLGFTAEAYHAKRFKTKNQREEMLERVRNGKTQAMIAMRSMVLGLDIPRATGFFNLLPTAHPQNYFQEFSRVRTPYEVNDEQGNVQFIKSQGWVIDFRDNHHILKACYRVRRRVYQEENATEINDDLSDEQRGY